jgi:hypothetical protein
MLRAGNTATRTREWIELLARKMDFDSVSVSLSFDSITASLRHPGGWDTAMREIGPLAIGVWRIGELERLAKTLALRPAPGDIAIKLEIESALRASNPQRVRAEKHSALLAVREISTVVRHGFVKWHATKSICNRTTTWISSVVALIDSDWYRVDAYFEETKIPRIKLDSLTDVQLMDGATMIQGKVESIARGITDQDNRNGPELLASVNPTFTWVRLAQRIPVR